MFLLFIGQDIRIVLRETNYIYKCFQTMRLRRAVGSQSSKLRLPRDRRCLDQLFVVGGTMGDGCAAPGSMVDHTAVVEFLLEKGAAAPFSRRKSTIAVWSTLPAPRSDEGLGGSQERRLRPPAVVVLDFHGGFRGQQQLGALHAAVPRRPRWTSRTTTAGGLSRCQKRFENRFSPAITMIVAVQ